MVVSVQTLEGFLLFETLVTEEKVVTIFAHVTVLDDLYFAGKTLILFIIINLGLENNFHLMVWFMIS
jgi:hypothetical protein